MIHFKQHRKAFSMITAIFVILMMATVGGFIMNLSGKMVQETASQYRKEQAILYAKSYTEFAIMAATQRTCVRKIRANVGDTPINIKKGKGYYVEVILQYVGNNSACPNKVSSGNIRYKNSIDTILLIDTYVRYRDPEHPNAVAGLAWSLDPGITYHRRTLQKL
jgi:flagellar basal body-associated protein FliL